MTRPCVLWLVSYFVRRIWRLQSCSFPGRTLAPGRHPSLAAVSLPNRKGVSCRLDDGNEPPGAWPNSNRMQASRGLPGSNLGGCGMGLCLRCWGLVSPGHCVPGCFLRPLQDIWRHLPWSILLSVVRCSPWFVLPYQPLRSHALRCRCPGRASSPATTGSTPCGVDPVAAASPAPSPDALQLRFWLLRGCPGSAHQGGKRNHFKGRCIAAPFEMPPFALYKIGQGHFPLSGKMFALSCRGGSPWTPVAARCQRRPHDARPLVVCAHPPGGRARPPTKRAGRTRRQVWRRDLRSFLPLGGYDTPCCLFAACSIACR